MPDSPFDVLVQSFNDAKTQMQEATKAIKADIVRPLDPNAQILTRQQRLSDFEDFMDNPARRESEFLRLRERYNLPDDKPIPRRLVDYVIQGLRDQNRASKDSSYEPPTGGLT